MYSNHCCPVCYDESLKDVILLPCGHHFCLNCIKNWLKTTSQCPVCRRIYCKPIGEKLVQKKLQDIKVTYENIRSWEDAIDPDNFQFLPIIFINQNILVPKLLIVDDCQIQTISMAIRGSLYLGIQTPQTKPKNNLYICKIIDVRVLKLKTDRSIKKIYSIEIQRLDRAIIESLYPVEYSTKTVLNICTALKLIDDQDSVNNFLPVISKKLEQILTLLENSHNIILFQKLYQQVKKSMKPKEQLTQSEYNNQMTQLSLDLLNFDLFILEPISNYKYFFGTDLLERLTFILDGLNQILTLNKK